MKVLVVDDIATNRKLLRTLLESEGMIVVEAENGVEALEQLGADSFDLVISDILMPKMDGYRLFQEIRHRPQLANLPIVAYTSTYLSAQDEELSLRSGANRYLRKPAPNALLLATLRELSEQAPGSPAPSATSLPNTPELLAQYNTALIRKLEEKSEELRLRNEELFQLNRELADSRARFESIIASAMDAIIAIDESQRIVLLNAAAEAMFGLSRADLLGQPLTVLLPERFRAGHAAHIARFATSGVTSRKMGALGAISGRRANGEEFPIEAAISKTDAAGKILFTVILRDISERKHAEEQVQQANVQLRALAERSENVREFERTAIAREIHDVLAQDLTGLKIDLIWLAKRIAQPTKDTTRDALAKRLADAIGQTDAAITTVQRIATELRPIILDSLGLPAAVEWQVEEFARRTGIECHAQTPHRESLLPGPLATALFRILQESLTNVARHAQATAVTVDLVETADLVELSIADNGRGIPPAQIADPRAIGLVGMRERAQAHGGSLEISSTRDQGTTVRVSVPFKADEVGPIS